MLFRISQCLAAAGRYAEALPHLGRLERDFPKSRFVAAAQKLRSTFPAGSTPAVSSPAPPQQGPAPRKPRRPSGTSDGVTSSVTLTN